jgi:hypothetical protein
MLPDSIAKRDLLWAEHKSPPDYGRYADEFLAAGWTADALEFAIKSGDGARQKKIVQLAIREGDASLLARAAGALPDLVDPAAWRECAKAAERDERWTLARQAWEKAGDRAEAAAANEKVLKAIGYTVGKAGGNEGHAPGNPRPAQA